MKVAIVSPYDLGLPGGVQDQVIKLSGWLDDMGHDSVVVGPGTDGPHGAVLVGRTRSITANRSSTPIALNPKVSGELRDAVSDADIVHIHEPLMPMVGTAATSIGTQPTVGTFHADPPGWARFGYRVGSSVLRKAIGRLDVVTTVSAVAGSAIAPFVDARIIPNGIDVDRYGGERKISNRVSFLGRDDQRKGLQVLLDAWPSVVDAVPDAQLRVVGAKRDDVIEGVSFLGRLDGSEKRSELAKSEVFCAPNLGGESFGIVVAEGMASSCAVVASAIPAFVAVLGDSGTFVAPGDPEGLAEGIIALLVDEDLRESKQADGRRAVDRFDGPSVAALYLDAYEDAIARFRS